MQEHTAIPGVEASARSPWSESIPALLVQLGVEPVAGLTAAEALRRLQQDGPNELQQTARRSIFAVLVSQFKSIVVLLLVAAAAISFGVGQHLEAGAILMVLLINGMIGFATELQATRSVEALQRLGTVTSTVRRGGEVLTVPAEELVRGDVVLFEGGDVVTADLRLIEASLVTVDESVLTGEALPVDKEADTLPPETPLPDRRNMLYKGTAIARGAGAGLVVATGMRSELGRIASLIREARSQATPLERRLDHLGRSLVLVTLVISVVVAILGVMAGREMLLVIETAIALAVAAVPEGLPIIATVALARGMLRMVRRNALVRRLSAVETLGATSIICSDKTGTLTENRMTVATLDTADGAVTPAEAQEVAPAVLALELAVLCNNASLGDNGQHHGDPLEVALLQAAATAGMAQEGLVDQRPRLREVAFDPETRMMATVHRSNAQHMLAIKGAPEAVLASCSGQLTSNGVTSLDDAARQRWQQRADALTATGSRVIGVATRQCVDDPAEVYAELAMVALVGLLDPPRGDVPEAIAHCRDAGLRVVMVTGDHPATAASIAAAVGLVEDPDTTEVLTGAVLDRGADGSLGAPDAQLLATRVFARVSPRQKLNLIDLHQRQNQIVAMTGDGVNDAPALRQADIGVAMGQRGTDVAREASDLVLLDDAFPTIVFAVEQGRVIFNNIRAFVIYLLSCNLSEVLVVGLATISQLPLPLLPLQILFLNLVTDVFPALALGVNEGDPEVMHAPPRDAGEPILTRGHWRQVIGYGAVMTVGVLAAFFLALEVLELAPRQAGTVAFTSLAFAQVLHVFNMNAPGTAAYNNAVIRNRWVWGAVLLCTVLVLGSVHIAPIAHVLSLKPLPTNAWLLVAAAAVVPVAWVQTVRALRTRLA